MSEHGKWRRRGRRLATWGGLGLVGLVLVAAVVARVFFHGERLAEFVQGQINSRIRGSVSVANIEWPLSQFPRVLVGGFVEFELYDIQVFDERGERLIAVPHARTQLDIGHLLMRRGFRFRDIDIDGGSVIIREGTEPYPAREDDVAVVTLISAFYPPSKPPTSRQEQQRASMTWSLESFRARNVDATFEFPSFTAHATGAATHGWLYYEKAEGDPRTHRFFSFQLLDMSAPSGDFALLGLPAVPLTDVAAPVLEKHSQDDKRTDLAPDITWRGTATSLDGAAVAIDGGMIAYWQNPTGGDYEIDLKIERAGAVAALLADGYLSGPQAAAHVRIHGNRHAPEYEATVTALEVNPPALECSTPADCPQPPNFHASTATVHYEAATRSGQLLDTQLTGAGGTIAIGGRFALEPLDFVGTLRIAPGVELRPWLDPKLVAVAGGSALSGSVAVDLDPTLVHLSEIQLSLGEAKASGALSIDFNGGIENAEAEGLLVKVGGAWARMDRRHGRNRVDVRRRTINLAVSFGVSSLRPWLRRFRQPLISGSASGTASVTGSFDDPRVDRARVTVHGLPLVDSASATLRYAGGLLTISDAHSAPLGGELTGNGKLQLTGAPRILELRVGGTDLDLSRIPQLGPVVNGLAMVHASAKGPLRAPVSTVVAEVEDLSIAGESYNNFLLTGRTEGDGSSALQFHVDRARGGRLDLNASVSAGGDLGGSLSMREIPIHSLPVVVDASGESDFGGMADAELLLSGTLGAPTADGYVTSTRTWFKEAFLGTAEVSLERLSHGRTGVTSRMFQNKVSVTGEITTYPGYGLDLNVGFRRVELDQFFPELAAAYDLRGWMSGRFERLMLAPGQPPTFTLRLSELVMVLDNEDDRGRPHPVKVRNLKDVLLAYDGDTARFVEPAQFRGPTGDFEMSGTASERAIAVQLIGTVDVALLSPYLRTVFTEATGSIATRATIEGPPDALRETAILELHGIKLRPAGQDAEVRIDNAKVDLNSSQLVFTNFTVDVYDEITQQTDRLELKGGVRLDAFEPVGWGLSVEGDLAGKLLLAVAPDWFTAASGSAQLDLRFLGGDAMPNIQGTLAFADDRPLTFTPRGLRREILLNKGSVEFIDQDIEFAGIGGTIDDSGILVDFSGELSLDDWKPADVDLRLAASALPFRIPRVLELELDVRNLRVVGDLEGLEIDGDLDIIDGRYIQRFNPILSAFQPQRVAETETPFYESIPLLANAKLGLTLTTGGGFGIKNNVANIDLNGAIEVLGTPLNPRFDGTVLVQRGDFKFQGMRTRFDRTEGSINFSRFDRFPDSTPTVDIHSESEYRDSRGTQHDVVLELKGTYDNLNWDLYTTNTGLNRTQTFTLLVSGRTAEENRALFGDDPVAPTNFDGRRSTASTQGQIDVLDQITKDYVGDAISALFGDPLSNATGIDVVRIEVGTSGVGGRIEEKIAENTRFVTEFERTINGFSFSMRGEHRLDDDFKVELEWLIKDFFEDTDEDLNARRAKGVLSGKWY